MPVGNATVTGILQPSEDSDVMRIPSSVSRITTATLVQMLNSTVHDGYLVADTPIADARSVTPRIPAAVKVPLHWRNVVYVGNWSTFAIIILAMWIRVSRDEAETTEAKREVQHS
jgi:hypothetical protein